ncbi:MAG TPA: hypothetical protein VGK99_12415 [Acidobacteriota bacterium]|jgi:hypothetical protein
MARIFYLHWNQKEAEERTAQLQAEGFDVSCHWSTELAARFGAVLPEVVVISLDRLPSHGRSVAEWFWEAKKRQHIPIIFAGGDPEKVSMVRKQFPKAVFCSAEEVPSELNRILSGT